MTLTASVFGMHPQLTALEGHHHHLVRPASCLSRILTVTWSRPHRVQILLNLRSQRSCLTTLQIVPRFPQIETLLSLRTKSQRHMAVHETLPAPTHCSYDLLALLLGPLSILPLETSCFLDVQARARDEYLYQLSPLSGQFT